MAGTLEPVPKGFMTPKDQTVGYKKSTSTGYSDARSVKGSPKPPPSVADQAKAQSDRERLEREFNKAANGGKSRRRKSKKSKKTKRRSRK